MTEGERWILFDGAEPSGMQAVLGALDEPPAGETVGEEAGSRRFFERARAAAVRPFRGETVGSGEVSFPRLTVEEYASFCAEMTVYPEWWAAIFLRYRVLHAAARGALDAHWGKCFLEQAEVRAVFEEKLSVFTAWLRLRRG